MRPGTGFLAGEPGTGFTCSCAAEVVASASGISAQLQVNPVPSAPAPFPLRRAAVLFLAAESLLGLAWWVALLVRPDLGSVFLPAGVEPSLIRTFVAADLASYVAAPVAAAVGLARERRWALPVLWLHAGGALYAALWGWGLVAVTGTGLLGAALMTPPAVAVPLLAARLSS